MAKIVFDIETIAENFDEMDETTRKVLAERIPYTIGSKKYEQELAALKRDLVFSPLTGRIVAIGVLDIEKHKGVVYFQSPDVEAKEFEEDMFLYKPMDERQMLESFWGGARQYDEFISFNGRLFDAPYLIVRSAVHKVQISKNLMSHRYLESQRYGPKHVDLYDQLTFYGALHRPANLHMWCRAFGITSSKAFDVKGSDVAQLFHERKYLEIARYNARDVQATKELYEYWNSYVRQ